MNHYRQFLLDSCNFDSAHDITHTERVVRNAQLLAKEETCDEEVVLAAAWLHDCVIVPKDDPNRKKASKMAAEKATIYLKSIQFDNEKIPKVAHAIESHSFSAGIKPKTLEAKIVQDADRLDALGAIGIARCFMVGGQMNRSLYQAEDPFCIHRVPDDSEWTIDHFYTKLFKLPELMNVESAKKEAMRRVDFMKLFLDRMDQEISPPPMS
tara:strand:+ start:13630 stop:14259 length:630 start_codon:yes stop_codon:yes gene_type:complete